MTFLALEASSLTVEDTFLILEASSLTVEETFLTLEASSLIVEETFLTPEGEPSAVWRAPPAVGTPTSALLLPSRPSPHPILVADSDQVGDVEVDVMRSVWDETQPAVRVPVMPHQIMVRQLRQDDITWR